MECEICQKAVATVHLTDVSNNAKKEIHLCETCAEEKGTTIKSHMNKEADFPEFKAHELMTAEFSETDPDERDLMCPQCGTTYRKFRSTGKFGCPNDYDVFGQQVVQLLEKIHHKVQHTGKIPSRATKRLSVEKEVVQLRDELQTAISLEQYERAAELRDRIYSLEKRCLGAEEA